MAPSPSDLGGLRGLDPGRRVLDAEVREKSRVDVPWIPRKQLVEPPFQRALCCCRTKIAALTSRYWADEGASIFRLPFSPRLGSNSQPGVKVVRVFHEHDGYPPHLAHRSEGPSRPLGTTTVRTYSTAPAAHAGWVARQY
jgi:hypothetical protein